MKIEGFQRKQLKAKKEEEKQSAESELFRDLDEMEHKNQLLVEQKQRHVLKDEERKAIVESAERQKADKDSVMKGKAISATRAMIDKENKPSNIKQTYDDGDIFGEEDIVTLPPTASQSSRTFQEVTEPTTVKKVQEIVLE